MIPEKEVRICDLCGEYYPVVLGDPDYKFTYLDKKLDLCNNCYDDITRMMELKKPKPTVKSPGTTQSDFMNPGPLGYEFTQIRKETKL